MKKFLILSSFYLLSQSVLAQPLAAIMTFESKAITAEGVTKQTHFQEHFIRSDNTVWSERIIAAPNAQTHSHDSHQEQHDHAEELNFTTAAKWLVREPNQSVNLRFVRSDEQKIIVPRTSEYGTLGFNGDWESAYHLIARKALETMQPSARHAPAGAQWYEKNTHQDYARVLWDKQRAIALAIESGRKDGTLSNKMTLTIAPMPRTLPWDKVAGFNAQAYEDLLD